MIVLLFLCLCACATGDNESFDIVYASSSSMKADFVIGSDASTESTASEFVYPN